MRSSFSLLLGFIIVKTICLALYIATGPIGLGPDEAQYWTWSRLLDWGYYSKPPGIAFQIRLGCWLFGETEFGVRCGSLLLGALLPLTLYAVGRAANLSERTAAWSAIAIAVAPVGLLASLLAITDVGMVLMWTIALIPLIRSLATERPCSYDWIGCAIAIGALFKWPIYLLWLAIWAARPWLAPLKNGPIWRGMALSLLGLFPSIIWNRQHDWMTLRHVWSTIIGRHATEQGTTALSHGNAVDFIGAQALLLSPVFCLLLILALIYLWKSKAQAPTPLLFCGGATALFFGSFIAIALFQKIQGNWCIFAYPMSFIALGWYASEKLVWGERALRWGLFSSLALTLAALASPFLPIPLRSHPFKHNLGWHEISPALKQAGYDPQQQFLFADSYQTTSLLSFYGPEQKRAYFLNLKGIRQNQFTQWPSMAEERKGGSGFFALILNDEPADEVSRYETLLAPYFERIHVLKPSLLFDHVGKKRLFLFFCQNYNGTLPKDGNLSY